MEIVSAHEGVYLIPHRICCVLALDTINYKHYITKLKEEGMVVDVAKDRKPRSAVLFQNGLVLICSTSAETIRDRIRASGEI